MASGRPLREVARDPWRETLYAFALLREHEVLTERMASVEQVRTAHRVAVAFHDPKRLDRMEQTALAKLMTHTVTDREYVAAKVAEIRAQRARGTPVEVMNVGD